MGQDDRIRSLRTARARTISAIVLPLALLSQSAWAEQGRLRVEETGGHILEVVIDSRAVGKTPWEGAVEAGNHVLWLRGMDLGSAPVTVVVTAGQTVSYQTEAKYLGQRRLIQAEPDTATIKIDGVPVANGWWVGRLPLGAHVVEAGARGYDSQSLVVDSALSSDPSATPVTFSLKEVGDRPVKRHAEVWLEAFGDYVAGASFESDVEEACTQPCDGHRISGYRFGARAGYRIPIGLSFTLAAGFLHGSAAVNRVKDEIANGLVYHLYDDVVIEGPLFALGADQKFRLTKVLAARIGVEAGPMVIDGSDTVGGRATSSNGMQVPISYVNATTSVLGFLSPRAGFSAQVGPFEVGASAAFWISFRPSDRRYPSHPSPVSSTPVSERELAYGSFWLFMPELAVDYAF